MSMTILTQSSILYFRQDLLQPYAAIRIFSDRLGERHRPHDVPGSDFDAAVGGRHGEGGRLPQLLLDGPGQRLDRP